MPPNIGTASLEVNLDLRKATQQYQRFQRTTNQNRKSSIFSSISSDARDFESSLGKATNRVVAFGAAAAIFQTLSKSTSAFADSLIKVEASLAKININFNESAEGIRKFGAGLFNVARQTGQSFDVAAKSAEEFARQGLSAEETLKRVNAALILSRRSGLDAADSTDAITAALNSFNSEALDSVSVVSKLVAVDTRFAVSSKDIAQGIARAGSTAQAAGVGIDELIGLITSLQQTTTLGGANIGNGLKSIFTRIQAAPETIAALQSVGVAIKNTDGNLRSATDILKDYAVARDKVGDVERAALDRTIAGGFQINKLKAALLDISKANGVYARSTQIAANATDEAITQNQKLNETLESLINQTTVSLTQLFSALGNRSVGPIFKDLLRSFEDARKYLSGDTGDQLGEALGNGILKGISNVISGPAITGLLIILVNTFKKVLGTIAQEARTLLQINSAANARANVQQQINNLLAQANEIEKSQIANAATLLQKQEALLVVQARLNAEAAVGTAIARSFVVPSNRGGFKMDPRLRPPGFADPVASAITRESKASGLPKSSIYVDRDSRVASFANPLGLLVANKRDEPKGGYQGVDRVLAQGGNPRLGSVPGFASPLKSQAQIVAARFGLNDPRYDEVTDSKAKTAKAVTALDAALTRSAAINADLNEKAKKLADTLAIVNKGFEGFKNSLQSSAYSSPIGPQDNPFARAIVKGNSSKKLTAEEYDAKMAAYSASQGPYSGGGRPPSPPTPPTSKAKRYYSNAYYRDQQESYISNIDPYAASQSKIRVAEFRANRNKEKREAQQRILEKAENERLAKAERRSQGYRNLALASSFVLPIAAGFIPEGKGGTGRGQALGAASGALNGAGIGGIFGPGGEAAGAVVGALVGAFNKATKSLDEFTAEVDNSAAAQSKMVDAAVKIRDIDERIGENKSGGGNPQALTRLATQRLGALQQITDPDVRSRLSKGFSNDTEASDFYNNLQEQAAQKGAAGETSKLAFSQNQDDFFSKLYKFIQLPEKLIGKLGVGVLTGGVGNGLASLGRYNEKNYQQKTDIKEIESDRRSLAQSVLAQITPDNVSKINTKGLQIGNEDASAEQLKNLTDIFSTLGSTVEVTQRNYRELAQGILDGTKAFGALKKQIDAVKAGAATNRLAEGSFLSKPNADVFGQAALTGRNPLSNRGSRAQSRLDLFDELKSAKAVGFSDIALKSNSTYQKAAAGVQANNIGDILIKFLEGNNSNVGRLRDDRGNPNLNAIQTVLEQVAKSGTSNSELAEQLLKLIPELKNTLSDNKVKNISGGLVNGPNQTSGYQVGADYGAFNKIKKRAFRSIDAKGNTLLSQVPVPSDSDNNKSATANSQVASQTPAARDADINSYLKIAQDAKAATDNAIQALQSTLNVVVTVNGLTGQDNSTLASTIQDALRTLGVPVPKPLPPSNNTANTGYFGTYNPASAQ